MYPEMPYRPPDPTPSGITIFNAQARPLFERARGRGDWHLLIASLLHRCTHLLRLDDYLSPRMNYSAQTSQIQSVEVARIRGSMNRSEDFDCDFYPLSNRLEDRWIRIASMMLQGAALPPVELVQVGQDYFVIDGHHRVSVARMLKATTIDAVITASYD